MTQKPDNPLAYVYALFHEPSKSFVRDCGYYGNSHSIYAFETKAQCEKCIVTYYSGQGYRARKMKVK